MSIAIIPPRTAPSTTALPVPKFSRKVIIASLIVEKTGPTKKYINKPVINRPKTGYKRIVFNPSNVRGRPLKAFFRYTMM